MKRNIILQIDLAVCENFDSPYDFYTYSEIGEENNVHVLVQYNLCHDYVQKFISKLDKDQLNYFTLLVMSMEQNHIKGVVNVANEFEMNEPAATYTAIEFINETRHRISSDLQDEYNNESE